MYVPSYIPDQIEIDGNVAEAKWSTVVGFVRRVTTMHLITLLVVAFLVDMPVAVMGLEASIPFLIAALACLSLTRGIGKGKRWEQQLSWVLAPVMLVTLASLLRELGNLNWPIAALVVGPAIASAYSWVAGRDLSFLGMFLFAFGLSTTVVVALCSESRVQALEAALVNGLWVFYYVYDLAALLTRRRLGEEWGAVLDLYRDVLNLTTYPIRVWRHWAKHRLWSIPK
ncbi:MAG TPA: hypothetical protein PKA27_07685 [Fimbriimonadaceae bacterium]|nr:hypothetical protein [Fimbriimonadaceae bacterium]